VEDEDGTVNGDMVREGAHTGKAGEREAIKSSHLERPKHFMRAPGKLGA